MTESADPVIESEGVPDARLERVLDAAGELLARFGYQRVTVDDVARAAGIGKGTVYLHFRTKEALFLTVLLRGHRAVTGDLADGMRADPAQVLPGRMMSTVYRRLAADPVTRRVYLGDPETFGRLAHEAAGTLTELSRRRELVLGEHIALLRRAGLLRTDVDAAAQRYLLGAVATGFYLLDPETAPGVPADPAVRAGLLEYALGSVLQAGGSTPDAALAEEVAAHYESLIEHIDEEWRRRLR